MVLLFSIFITGPKQQRKFKRLILHRIRWSEDKQKRSKNTGDQLVILRQFCHGVEPGDLTDRVHGISCRYSDKTSKQTYHTFFNTRPIFIKQSAHTS